MMRYANEDSRYNKMSEFLNWQLIEFLVHLSQKFTIFTLLNMEAINYLYIITNTPYSGKNAENLNNINSK